MLKLITAPTIEPVTLAEARLHLNVTAPEDDTLIAELIRVAREQAEKELQRQLCQATWDYYLDDWPGDEIQVPKPPLSSVTSVKYYDENGAQQTLSSTYYNVDTVSEPGRIWLAYGYTWPNLQTQYPAAVVIRFVAGVQTAVEVPASVRSWILLQVGALYEHREAFSTDVAGRHRFVPALLDDARVFVV